MSSIIESYRVVKTREDSSGGLPTIGGASQLPEDDEFVPRQRQGPKSTNFEPRDSVINKAEDSLEDKAYHELMTSLGQRVKAIDNDTHELTIMTGGASAIKVKVVGYEHPDLVDIAKAQEDALPPVETPRTTAPDSSLEATDQVDAVTKYNTDQYMKHSRLNPKKFG